MQEEQHGRGLNLFCRFPFFSFFKGLFLGREPFLESWFPGNQLRLQEVTALSWEIIQVLVSDLGAVGKTHASCHYAKLSCWLELQCSAQTWEWYQYSPENRLCVCLYSVSHKVAQVYLSGGQDTETQQGNCAAWSCVTHSVCQCVCCLFPSCKPTKEEKMCCWIKFETLKCVISTGLHLSVFCTSARVERYPRDWLHTYLSLTHKCSKTG